MFDHVVRDGALPTDWLAGQIAALARNDGDIDTLMQRLAGVRVWSYIAARADWVRDAAHWQAKAREVEDLLSDALHERLTSRFVDRRSAHLLRRLEAGAGEEQLLSAVTRRGEIVVEGHSVGHVGGFRFFPDPLAEGEARKLVLRAARRALREEMPRRVARLEDADDDAFAWDDDQKVRWDGAAVARVRRGATALRPAIEVLDSEFLDGAQRERVRARVQRMVDRAIARDLASLLSAADRAREEPALRGPVHQLTEALGLVPGATEASLPTELRAALKALGVRAGRFALFLPALLKPRPAAMRARLWALQHGCQPPALPASGLVSIPPPTDWPAGFAAAIGWIEAGPLLLRLDIAERVAAELGYAARRHPVALPDGLASRFSARAELLPVILRGLGLRVIPATTLAPGVYGPPAPAMVLPLRRKRVAPPAPDWPARAASGPFAALVALRR